MSKVLQLSVFNTKETIYKHKGGWFDSKFSMRITAPNDDVKTEEFADNANSVDCVLVLDTSGSMGCTEGSKTRLQHLKDSVLNVIEKTHSSHNFAMFTYNTEHKLVFPLMPMTDENKSKMRNSVQSLINSGATYPFNAMKEAKDILAKSTGNTKLILLFTDGDDIHDKEKAYESLRDECNGLEIRILPIVLAGAVRETTTFLQQKVSTEGNTIAATVDITALERRLGGVIRSANNEVFKNCRLVFTPPMGCHEDTAITEFSIPTKSVGKPTKTEVPDTLRKEGKRYSYSYSIGNISLRQEFSGYYTVHHFWNDKIKALQANATTVDLVWEDVNGETFKVTAHSIVYLGVDNTLDIADSTVEGDSVLQFAINEEIIKQNRARIARGENVEEATREIRRLTKENEALATTETGKNQAKALYNIANRTIENNFDDASQSDLLSDSDYDDYT